VTVTFVNRDQGIPHNVAFYTTSAATATIYKGQITSGSTPLIYTFTAPSTPGNYYFRCDVHPDMNGVFVVT
jgi:plastocyanin